MTFSYFLILYLISERYLSRFLSDFTFPYPIFRSLLRTYPDREIFVLVRFQPPQYTTHTLNSFADNHEFCFLIIVIPFFFLSFTICRVVKCLSFLVCYQHSVKFGRLKMHSKLGKECISNVR